MSQHTTQELVATAVNHDASGTFVACVATDVDGRHIAREVARKAARADGVPAMGGFTSHLWRGDVRGAWRRADHQSRALMRAAGVAPDDVGAEQ